jgi:hypothetical protein
LKFAGSKGRIRSFTMTNVVAKITLNGLKIDVVQSLRFDIVCCECPQEVDVSCCSEKEVTREVKTKLSEKSHKIPIEY